MRSGKTPLDAAKRKVVVPNVPCEIVLFEFKEVSKTTHGSTLHVPLTNLSNSSPDIIETSPK